METPKFRNSLQEEGDREDESEGPGVQTEETDDEVQMVGEDRVWLLNSNSQIVVMTWTKSLLKKS